MKKLKILVTGGAGFLGVHLCKRLLNEDHEVICLDNFVSSNPTNIENFKQYQNFTLIEHDVILPIKLDVDQIYNLACPASPERYQKDPLHTTKTCVLGALNMLDLATKCNATILQASTSEVYGDPLIHPQPENYWGNVNPIGKRSCYDEGKRCAESIFFDYQRKHNTKIKVMRIFNTYGPLMDPLDGRVVINFIQQALQGKDLTIYGTGHQSRSFCYIDDLIEGMIRMMNSEANTCGPINFGNPEEYSVLELAEIILKLTASSSKLNFLPKPPDDPQIRKPDISMAKNNFKWEPKTKLTDGLLDTIAYYKSITNN